MLKPRALRPGDRLVLVAPASPFDRDEFDRGVREIRALGFEPVFDDAVFARREYVAGAPELRAAAIHAAWQDRSIAGLIAVRGGYGSAQVLPLLDRDEARRACKPLVGYSDVTALLTFLTIGCGVVAFHGPMIDRRLSRGAEGYDADSFRRALCVAEPMGELSPDGVESIRAGEAAGPLLGGTLTQLLASIGTPFAFDPPDGHVLFLEEVNERPYRLDRMILQLRQTGILARASAVIIGELPGCDESAFVRPELRPNKPDGITARAVMADVLSDFPGPVLIGFPSGHTKGPVFTLPLGVTCRVIADRTPRLVIEESAVQ